MEDVDVLVRIRCAGCSGIFYLCESAYRGQLYCGEGCQRGAARESKARHQRSREGRLDHAARNADYHVRLKFVMDTRSDNLASESSSCLRDDASASAMGAHAVAAESTDDGANQSDDAASGARDAAAGDGDRSIIAADGRDLSYVEVNVVDGQGVLIPQASDTIQFTTDGPGTIVGVDNGNSTSHEPYKGQSRSAFSGKALVIVRATTTPGTVTLKATSGTLTGGSAVIVTKAP